MVNGWLQNPYNPSGVNGAGYEPTTAMLEALGNSPDAAKNFFTDPPTTYNEDGTVNRSATADLGKDKDGQAGLLHDRVTSELACPVGWVGRMSLCPSLIRKSSARTSCGPRGTAGRV